MAKIEIGSKVKYSGAFLRSIGEVTGDLPKAKGVVKDLRPLGKSITLAIVDWDIPDTPGKVNIKNLVLVGRPEYFESKTLASRVLDVCEEVGSLDIPEGAYVLYTLDAVRKDGEREMILVVADHTYKDEYDVVRTAMAQGYRKATVMDRSKMQSGGVREAVEESFEDKIHRVAAAKGITMIIMDVRGKVSKLPVSKPPASGKSNEQVAMGDPMTGEAPDRNM